MNKKENLLQPQQNCQIHEKFPIEYVCIDKNCKVKKKLACAKCHIQGDHSNHEFSEIDDYKITIKNITSQHMKKLEELAVNNDLTTLIETQLNNLKERMCKIIDDTSNNFIKEVQNLKGFNNAEKLAKYHQFYNPYLIGEYDLSQEKYIKESLDLLNGESQINKDLTTDIIQKKEIEEKINKKIGDINFLFTKFTESSLKSVMEMSIEVKKIQEKQEQQELLLQSKQQFEQINIEDEEQEDLSQLLKNFNGKKISIQNIHKGWVNTVLILNDNEIATASQDTTIKIWQICQTNFSKTTLTKILDGHKKSIYSLISISEKDNIIASGSLDKTIKIWDYKAGQLLKTLEGHTGSIYSLLKISDQDPFICSGGTDFDLFFWNWQEGNYFAKIKCHTSNLWCLVKLEDNVIASGSTDKSIKIWDIKEQKPIKTLLGHTDDVISLAKLRETNLISGSGNQDKSIKIWDFKNGVLLYTLEGHEAPVWSLAVLNQNEFVSLSYDSTMRFWTLKPDKVKQKQSQAIVLKLDGPNTFVTYKQLENNRKLLITGGTDFSLNYWY